MSAKRQNWILFAVFFVFFVAKNVIFHYFSFFEWLPKGDHGWLAWLAWLLPKMASAIALASLVFVLKDKRWMVIPALVVDIWCIANWIYMRNNNFLLDSFAFNIAGNLNGYWTSVFVFIDWGLDLCMIASSLLMLIPIRYLNSRGTQYIPIVICLLLSVGMHYMGEGCYVLSRPKAKRPEWKKDIASREGRERVYGIDYEYLVEYTSLMTMPIYLLPDHVEIKAQKVYDRKMTDEDIRIAHQQTKQPVNTACPESKLIIVICESLENWVCRDDIMPHLAALTHMDHVLYADNVQTQIIGAPSADGQMIINTGLLPLTEGYTCFRYPNNIYPGIMHTTQDSTVMILPHNIEVWNQQAMSPNYGYDTTIVYSDVDSMLFEKLNEVQRTGITHIQCITQSTHAPFVHGDQSKLEMPQDMPFYMSRFIRAFNVLDEGLGHFVDRIQNDPELREYTIVITADHHILYRAKRQEYARYCKKKGLDYHPESASLPLIIYSPKIQGNIHLTDTCYQMDIYPTLLHLTGAADHYPWQGLGVDLMDKEARTHRTIDTETANRLSDRLLRNDWFRTQSE